MGGKKAAIKRRAENYTPKSNLEVEASDLSATRVLAVAAKPSHPQNTSKVFEQGSTSAPCAQNASLLE